jgi:hypothetical protein
VINKFNFKNTILTVLLFSGVLLQIFAIKIYGNTIISWKILVSSWLLIGIACRQFTSSLLNTYYKTTNYFLQLVFNSCTFGGIFAFCFLASNFYFHNEKIETKKVEIIKTGHLSKWRGSCGKPYAVFKFGNTEKQVDFSCETEIEKYKYINLTIKEGFFGYHIIINKHLDN